MLAEWMNIVQFERHMN